MKQRFRITSKPFLRPLWNLIIKEISFLGFVQWLEQDFDINLNQIGLLLPFLCIMNLISIKWPRTPLGTQMSTRQCEHYPKYKIYHVQGKDTLYTFFFVLMAFLLMASYTILQQRHTAGRGFWMRPANNDFSSTCISWWGFLLGLWVSLNNIYNCSKRKTYNLCGGYHYAWTGMRLCSQ